MRDGEEEEGGRRSEAAPYSKEPPSEPMWHVVLLQTTPMRL